uniref:Uncharacterized protein n=1 Tax=Rhizophora mucronata TaxID=61149 RepID=A0A2P2MCK6_RHIMU
MHVSNMNHGLLQSSYLPSCRQQQSSSCGNHQVNEQNLGEKLFFVSEP